MYETKKAAWLLAQKKFYAKLNKESEEDVQEIADKIEDELDSNPQIEWDTNMPLETIEVTIDEEDEELEQCYTTYKNILKRGFNKMEEGTQKTEDGKTQEPKNVEEGANSTPNKTEDDKKFTQEDVNSIVAGRLAKEKEKYQDYDSLKTEVSELREVKTKYTELEKSSQIHLDTLSEVYTGLTSDLDDEKKNLIPEELSLTDKIKYINKNNIL